MLDQPFLAHRLVEAGVACKPLPFHKITAEVRCSTEPLEILAFEVPMQRPL